MSKNLVIIFTRNPELGKVKTRLAKTIGDESALNIYRFLLEHTEKTIRNLESDKAVYYSVKVRNSDIWCNNIYQKHQQEGTDLGYRMLNAFKNGFNNSYNKIIIVGSDLFDLQQTHIEDAFNALETNNFVIGPAEDGGYYLLGMTHLNETIFKHKVWGTSSVLKDTLDDLQNESVFLLEQLNDVDTYEDIKDNNTLKSFILQND